MNEFVKKMPPIEYFGCHPTFYSGFDSLYVRYIAFRIEIAEKFIMYFDTFLPKKWINRTEKVIDLSLEFQVLMHLKYRLTQKSTNII